jgi:hypothetical protein
LVETITIIIPQQAKIIFDSIIDIIDGFRLIDLLCLTPLSAIFQLDHDDHFYRWRKPEYPERIIDHGQATGKLYHLRLQVEYTLFCKSIIIPQQAKIIFDSIIDIIDGFKVLMKDPKTALVKIGKGVIQ